MAGPPLFNMGFETDEGIKEDVFFLNCDSNQGSRVKAPACYTPYYSLYKSF